MTTVEPIGIACWSVGQHARRNILPAINNLPLLTLRGIFTRNPQTLNEVSEIYGCQAYKSENHLLDDLTTQAIYLSSPNGVHHDQIKKCLLAGKSVLVEKSALPTLTEAEDIVEIALSKGLFVMEAFMYRFHSQFKILLQLLTSKKYGDILRVESDFGFPHLDFTDIRYQADLAGGALLDAGAYTLSATRQLLGNELQVTGATLYTEPGYAVDTRGYALLVANNGAVGVCSWVFGGSYINQIRIWCQHAHIIVDRAFSKPSTFDSNIQINVNGQLVETIKTGADNHFVNMLSYFAERIAREDGEFELKELLNQALIQNQVCSLGRSA